MSRIGDKPITIPNGVQVNFNQNVLDISGIKGKLLINIPQNIKLILNDQEITLERLKDDQQNKAIQGLNRSLIANAILGVSNGWSKTLRLVGVGYRVETDGHNLSLMVGFSHPVKYKGPEGITFTVKENDIIISGFDKQLVGEVTAQIRRIKEPEVYKGKGIRYKDEIIHLKPGKAAKTVGVGTIPGAK